MSDPGDPADDGAVERAAGFPEGAQIQVFYDGACPLCRREIAALRRRDVDGRIAFVDIAAPEFRSESFGLERDALMRRIHARLPDGTILTGVEVFRRLYAALGFERAVRASRLPGVRGALDWLYDRFAANRLRLTGRCPHRQGADP